MSQSQSFNNVTYTIPVQGDTKWGPSLTRYLAALGTYAINPAGGTYTLTADLNLGPTFGLLAPYYKSTTANIAATGVLRLAHADSIGWRNNANSADLMFTVNSSDQLLFNGAAFFSGSLTNGHILVGSAGGIATDVALTGDIAITNAGVSSVNSVQAGVITNAMVNNAAAIAYSKLSLTASIQNTDIYSAAAIAVSKLASLGASGFPVVTDASGFLTISGVSTTLAELNFVHGVTSAVQTQINTVSATASAALPKAGGTMTGNIAFTTPASQGIVGTTTNSSAAAGNVGEVIESVVSVATNLPATNTYGDLTSISPTAGSWMIFGVWEYTLNGATVTRADYGISTVTGNSGTGLTFGSNAGENPLSGSGDWQFAVPGYVVRLSGTTTYYLKYRAAFTAGTPQCTGRITAIRIC